MKPVGRLAAFAVVLAAVFAAALLAGRETDPEAQRVTDEHQEVQAEAHGDDGHSAEPVAADSGLVLELMDRELPLDERSRLRFRIRDAGGDPLESYEVEHERRMHLIVVRTDGTGFQHLHPRLEDGTWTTRIRLPDPGTYRAFADFKTAGAKQILDADIVVDGDAEYRELPAPAETAEAGPFEVEMTADGADLSFAVTREGTHVDVEEYLGAAGHLVALREGDLAYAHTHPEEHEHGPASFAAEFPGPGRYRLYFQFQVNGKVHTAEFTHEVDA